MTHEKQPHIMAAQHIVQQGYRWHAGGEWPSHDHNKG